MRTFRASLRNSGFSLLEGVFSLFLTFLVLGSLAYVLRQAAGVKSNVKNLDAYNEVTHALMLIKSDIRAASKVPTKRENLEHELTISRVDPRLGFLQRITLDDGSDSPYEPREQVTIRYYVEGGFLKKSTARLDTPLAVESLVGVVNFKVERLNSPELLVVSLETENERVRKHQSIKVALFL